MISLLLFTVATSAADSVNPIAITQQFVLQGMVKKEKHIWYYIVAIGLTNFAGGVLAYYGLATVIGEFTKDLIGKFGNLLYIVECVIGIVLLIFAIYLIYKNKIKKAKETKGENKDKKIIEKKIKNISPFSLVVLGVVATITELTTALPYFGFLTILFNYKLSAVNLLIILVIYNIIYSLPLVVMYFIYVKAQNKFDKMYKVVNSKMDKLSKILAPVTTAIIGIILIYHPLTILV